MPDLDVDLYATRGSRRELRHQPDLRLRGRHGAAMISSIHLCECGSTKAKSLSIRGPRQSASRNGLLAGSRHERRRAGTTYVARRRGGEPRRPDGSGGAFVHGTDVGRHGRGRRQHRLDHVDLKGANSARRKNRSGLSKHGKLRPPGWLEYPRALGYARLTRSSELRSCRAIAAPNMRKSAVRSYHTTDR
jgi:hypothetical protein